MLNNNLKKSVKGNKRPLTPKQKKALHNILENGGSARSALLNAGYSPAMAKNPKKVLQSKGFAHELEKVGLTDDVIAKKYQTLLNATNLEKDVFYAEKEITLKGKKKEITYKQLSNDKIRAMIEGTEEDPSGCKVAYIKTFEDRKEVFFRAPDNIVQKGIIELTGKVKSHFAPEKLDVTSHELDDNERKFLEGLMDNE